MRGARGRPVRLALGDVDQPEGMRRDGRGGKSQVRGMKVK
jgi:hypothetical protein